MMGLLCIDDIRQHINHPIFRILHRSPLTCVACLACPYLVITTFPQQFHERASFKFSDYCILSGKTFFIYPQHRYVQLPHPPPPHTIQRISQSLSQQNVGLESHHDSAKLLPLARIQNCMNRSARVSVVYSTSEHFSTFFRLFNCISCRNPIIFSVGQAILSCFHESAVSSLTQVSRVVVEMIRILLVLLPFASSSIV